MGNVFVSANVTQRRLIRLQHAPYLFLHTERNLRTAQRVCNFYQSNKFS